MRDRTRGVVGTNIDLWRALDETRRLEDGVGAAVIGPDRPEATVGGSLSLHVGSYWLECRRNRGTLVVCRLECIFTCVYVLN
jgi:hypothetical protein